MHGRDNETYRTIAHLACSFSLGVCSRRLRKSHNLVFVYRGFPKIQEGKTVGGGSDWLPLSPCFLACFCSSEIFCATVERRLLRLLSALYQKGAPRLRRP